MTKKASRVLVVDDDPGVREMFVEMLGYCGYDTVCAANGEEALREAKAAVPSVILLDVMMPQPDGMIVLKRLKSDPKTSQVPVIMVTVLHQEENVAKALALGASGYIVKPTTAECIVNKIKEVLGDSPNPPD